MGNEWCASTAVASCSIEPRVFEAYRSTTVRVRVRPTEAIQAGAVIACQLPNSFHAYRITQSHTQRLQVEDPAAPHHVSVQLMDPTLPVSFDVEIADRDAVVSLVRPVIRAPGELPVASVEKHGQGVQAPVRRDDIVVPVIVQVADRKERVVLPAIERRPLLKRPVSVA